MDNAYIQRYRQALIEAVQYRNTDTVDAIIDKIYEDGYSDGILSVDEE